MLERNPAVVVREEEAGHFLLFNSENCLPLVLNSAAHLIWQLCDGRRDSGEIEAAVLERFDLETGGVSEVELRESVRAQLRILERTALVRRAPGAEREG